VLGRAVLGRAVLGRAVAITRRQLPALVDPCDAQVERLE
jgi:hypothetical protein